MIFVNLKKWYDYYLVYNQSKTEAYSLADKDLNDMGYTREELWGSCKMKLDEHYLGVNRD